VRVFPHDRGENGIVRLSDLLGHSRAGSNEIVVAEKVESGAEGGSRTRTSFRTTDFKSRDRAIT
jgi:hypothetical protein